MPKFIRHRINTLAELSELSPGLGAEIDLRSHKSRVILNHEPFSDGPTFKQWIDLWVSVPNRGTLILNPKEDGLESEIIDILRAKNVEDWFFLDLTIPTLVRLLSTERRLAIRQSSFEPLEQAMAFKGKANWVWLDCFEGVPPSVDLVQELVAHFQVCLVSPELQGYPKDRIAQFKHLSSAVFAICTKHVELWL